MPGLAVEVHDLSVAYRHNPVLWGVDFIIPKGVMTAIVGPNGAGKSTLLKSMMGLVPLASGYVKVFDEPLDRRRSLVAYVPQKEEVDWDFPVNVYDVVMMGRYGRMSFFRRPGEVDRAAVDTALRQVGMFEYADRQISQLSGGQQQRVFIARALAQEAQLYLLDEPFAGIDATTETVLVDLFRQLTSEGKTIVCVHHDLSTIKSYFQWVVLVNLRLLAAGEPELVCTEERLAAAYSGRPEVLDEVATQLKQRGWSKRS